jgi:hypothetical protein
VYCRVSGWQAAPVIARFDDLADAVMATPAAQDFPHDMLRRLPAWTVLIPVPWLRPGASALVWMDAGTFTSPTKGHGGDDTFDELMVVFMDDVGQPVGMRMRFIERTIAESIEAQRHDRAAIDRRAQIARAEDPFAARFAGWDRVEVLNLVSALALYLCSHQPTSRSAQHCPPRRQWGSRGEGRRQVR